MTQNRSFRDKLAHKHGFVPPSVRHAADRGLAESSQLAHKAAARFQKAAGVTSETSWAMRLVRLSLAGTMFSGIVGLVVLIGLYLYFGQNLPDHQQLADYQPRVSTRAHAGDGRLVAEFAVERRIFLPIAAMPDVVKHAFISAEDKNFYHHHGLDFVGIVRAVLTNINNVIHDDDSLVGASTITQQVAKNFLLTREKTFTRKFKEAIIAFRIENALSKDRILELYLNEIYLGNRSYGVAAAAQDYFGKSLDEVTIAEAALLAALPKAPNNYNPKNSPQRALNRRDWVIGRMYANGYIDDTQRLQAVQTPLLGPREIEDNRIYASYFVEEVRRQLVEDLGRETLYGGGLTIRTTLDPTLQEYAEQALFQGLVDYDRRHGYRGALGHLPAGLPNTLDFLARYDVPKGTPRHWQIALVSDVKRRSASLVFQDGSGGTLAYQPIRWARRYILPKLHAQQNTKKTDQELLEDIGVIDERNLLRRTRPLGPYISRMSQVVERGDVILVSPYGDDPAKAEYELQQLPSIDGGMMVMDIHTGRVLAMVGGWSFQRSQYNRVTQASRQPGSAFKPFVYLSALENGFTPATRILDAPFVLDLDNGVKWKPSNYSRRYYGPSPMRLGIEKSRNLMTVRLAKALSMTHVREVAQRFAIAENMTLHLPNALGSIQTTLKDLTTAYAMLANGGKQVEATLIDRLQDRYGKTLVHNDKRLCLGCNLPEWDGENIALPELVDEREQMTDKASAYQIVSMLEGVVVRGTGRQIAKKIPKKVLAGKTGTTNNSIDTWFVGFTPELVTGVFVGFDRPQSLGMYSDSVQEAGSTVAVPIFINFMEQALQGRSTTPFRVPPDVQLVRINPATGTLSRSGDNRAIVEAFKPGTQPQDYRTASLLIGDSNSTTVRQNDDGFTGSTGNSVSENLQNLLPADAIDTAGEVGAEVSDLDQEAEEDELLGIY